VSGLVGSWRIIGAGPEWDFDLDLDEPAHLDVADDGRGELVFDLFEASVDARFVGDRIEFSWDGHWELDDKSGRGIAVLDGDAVLHIHLWVHLGDEIDLRAVRS
jgi:hypothetical protein